MGRSMRAKGVIYAGALCLGINLQAAANSPVADAAMRGDKSSVANLLKTKADVNAPQSDGATALQWAAYRNDLVLADLLISAGAGVRSANRDGATALQLASTNGSSAM